MRRKLQTLKNEIAKLDSCPPWAKVTQVRIVVAESFSTLEAMASRIESLEAIVNGVTHVRESK